MNTNEFGNYLREQRRKRGLTIRDVEAMSGVSNAHLSYLENGKRRPPSPETLQKLAGPLGVSYGELMAQAGYLSAGESDHEARTSKVPLDSVEAFEKVPVFEHLVPGIPLDEQKALFWMPKPDNMGHDEVFYTRVHDNGLAKIGLQEGARVLAARKPPSHGDVCICSIKNRLLIRRVFYVDGSCVLQGAGRDWAPVICKPEELIVLGVVVQAEVSID